MTRIAMLGFAPALLALAAGRREGHHRQHPRLRAPDGGEPWTSSRWARRNLQRERVTARPNTLLQGAYDAMIASLKADRATTFDRDYMEGQLEYQKGNAALFRYEIQNGTDPGRKEFAQHTLPKIEDHLKRALELAKSAEIARASSQ
jgi:hypothetical protein